MKYDIYFFMNSFLSVANIPSRPIVVLTRLVGVLHFLMCLCYHDMTHVAFFEPIVSKSA